MAEPIFSLRALTRSVISLAVINLASMAVAFMIGILLARLLGASGYGAYGLAMSVATLVGIVVEFGLPTLAVREVAAASASGRWDLIRGLLIWSNRIVMTCSAILLVGLFAFDWLRELSSESQIVATARWAILLVPIVGLAKIRGQALLSLGRTVAGQTPVLILRPAIFLLALAAAWAARYGIDPPTAMALQVGAAFLALLVVAAVWRHYEPDTLRETAPAYAVREWASACIPMGATEGLRLLQGQSAILLLGLLATSSDVGVYRVADNIVLVTAIGHSVLAMATSPLFAGLKAAGKRAELQRILTLSALAMTGSTIALGLPVVLLGSDFLAFLFGPEFRASYHPFLIAWLAMIVSGTFGPVQVYANMVGYHRLVTAGFLLNVVTCIIISVLTIPRAGASGAAIGLLAGVCLSNAWLWWQIRSRDRLDSSIFSRRAFGQIRRIRLGCLIGKGK